MNLLGHSDVRAFPAERRVAQSARGRSSLRRRIVLAVLLTSSLGSAAGLQRASTTTVLARRNVQVSPNLTYRTAGSWTGKLDLYVVAGKGPRPVIVNFHGGGWTENVKERAQATLLPFLETGWAVANVEYRLASAAPAPAAIEDARCAIRWLADRARMYDIDPSRFVLMGDSAGAHLALMAGMLPANGEFDRGCTSKAWPRVAAIVNYYGVSDVAEVTAGKNQRSWAVAWLGNRAGNVDFARKLSPLTYVRGGVPPVITLHGDSDPVVPYTQSIRLHEALTKAGVPNRLVTIKAGGHGYGGFSSEETIRSHRAVEDFLFQQGSWPRPR